MRRDVTKDLDREIKGLESGKLEPLLDEDRRVKGKSKRRSFVKEIRAELVAMRAGKAPIEEYTGREGAELKAARGIREGKALVDVSRATFAKLTKVARREKMNVSELIDKIAKGLK